MAAVLLDLPQDVLLQNIVGRLCFKDKLSLGSTCRQGHKCLLSPGAWPEVTSSHILAVPRQCSAALGGCILIL